ncbi:unnamed protein product [Cuscuta europaea]|uniref:Protein kinase domain-containing protein n=1 Tax=Cuscuta europaea TaxID=41803 RepID=A0A9P0YXT7_CUSEU|nr:unnamed protein product [Cuscuta europaea]
MSAFAFLFLLPLFTLVPTSLVRLESTSASFAPLSAPHRKHFNPSILVPSSSPVIPGPVPSPVGKKWRKHHRGHHHPGSTRPAISPATESACGQICSPPFASIPLLSRCDCVFPMKVKLVVGVSLYAVFPVIRELGLEVAAETYLDPHQVVVVGASADSRNQEWTVVDLNLVPLGEKFDDTTAQLTSERFWKKNVTLNHTLFGDYEVMSISYPGLSSSPPTGSSNGPSSSSGTHQFPVTADLVDTNQKLSPRLIFLIASSALVLLVILCGAIVIMLKCRRQGRPSSAVGPAFVPSLNKRSGMGSMIFSSPASSMSLSLASAMPSSVLSVRTFALAELEKATEKFSSKRVLGEGGFGRVYHGVLEDNTEIAVKLLTRGNNQNGDREFIAEVEMLSRLHHRNLVKLIGICIEGRTRCLVYEVVPNGSVESHLHGIDKMTCPLDWDARLKIALGAARGLAYLHEDSNPRVIHRDFKASNVLLEDDYTPKVSDFGLAREATEGSQHISTRVMGTFGYVAPEYAMTGHLLVKSDVYSYGVVLLELLSGRKPVDMSQPPGQENLVTWARPLLTTREGLKQMVDPSLAGSHYDFDDMAKVAAIASMCVHPEVTQRPFMGEVVQALKLIYNDDTGEDDGCSLKESSLPDSEYKNGDQIPSDSSWWNAGAMTPRLTYGIASSFMTMEYSCDLLEDRPFSSSRLVTHGNRSGPLRSARGNPIFYKPSGSMSEHGGALIPRRSWNNRNEYEEASF